MTFFVTRHGGLYTTGRFASRMGYSDVFVANKTEIGANYESPISWLNNYMDTNGLSAQKKTIQWPYVDSDGSIKYREETLNYVVKIGSN